MEDSHRLLLRNQDILSFSTNGPYFFYASPRRYLSNEKLRKLLPSVLCMGGKFSKIDTSKEKACTWIQENHGENPMLAGPPTASVTHQLP